MPFDEQKAQRKIDFIEKLCTHTKGRWAGCQFNLIPWQTDLVSELFGRVKDNGCRQYRMCYCEIPKKNGKSELAAALALAMLVADDEQGAEVYSAAADIGQAGLVYHVAAQMVRNSKVLSKRLKVVDSKKRIIDYQTNSFYQVLSSEAFTKHGINPSAIIFDELHAQPNRELWDVLVEGTDVARQQQLIFAITTAGIWDPTSICWEVRERARQIKEGIIDDPTVLPIIYAAEKEEDWEDPEVWKRNNPSLGHIFELDNLETHYQQAKENPARQNNFRRFRINQWVNQISRYIPIDKWDECKTKIDKGSLLKRECYGGLDLSSTTDLTAFSLVFPPQKLGEKWITISHFYVPEDTIIERSKKDRVLYDMWAKAGYITATPGNVVDYAYVRRDVNKATEIYNLVEVAYDPWGAVKLAVELNEEDGITMVEHRQGFKSMSPPTKELLKLVKSLQLAHDGNPVLRWCADNLVVKVDAAENVKPDKEKATERIDGVVSTAMALGRAILTFELPSVYEERGIEVW